MFELLGINFHWYGLLIGLGIWVAMEISLKQGASEKLMWWTVIAGVIGARLYHVIDFWNRYYSINLINILYFWEGGLGIWGAIAGGTIGLLIYCYFNKLKFVKTLDTLVIGVPLAQAIGRVGNFVNGELMGKNGEPLFAYEGILNLILFGILMIVSKKKNKIGMRSGIYLAGYGVIRLLLENLRSPENIWRLMNIPMAVIFGVISVLLGIWMILRSNRTNLP
jgi:phosphatidylglycerol:prolipoprotein diacylglycerol transferase